MSPTSAEYRGPGSRWELPLPARRSPALQSILAVMLTTAFAGCGGEPSDPGREAARRGPASTRSDSAGVEIVESRRPAWSEAERWRFSPEPAFVIHGADGGEENLLLDPTSIDVDSRGRIIVGDGSQVGWNAVLVYDASGRFLFRAGGEGEGPGEFGQLWWASAYRGDSIVAFDMSGDELAVFDPEGGFARQVRPPALDPPSPPEGTMMFTAGTDAAFGDGWFLTYPYGTLDVEGGPGPAWYRHLLVRLAPNGEDWDTLGTFEISRQHWDGTDQHPVILAPFAVKAVGEETLYFGRGDRFEFGVHDASGRLVRIVRWDAETQPVTPEVKELYLEWMLERLEAARGHQVPTEEREAQRQRLEERRFAEVLPAFVGMVLDDDGNLWMQSFRWYPSSRAPVDDPGRSSVFDPTGVWLGDLETPPHFDLQEVADGRAYGFVTNELGVEELYAYDLVKPGG